MRYVVHRNEPHDVYIGRGTIWGNPYSHLENSTARFKVRTVEEAVEKYAEYLQTREDLLSKIKYLRGKILGCCGRDVCHGHILAALANDGYDPSYISTFFKTS
jgi:hypothetical protein